MAIVSTSGPIKELEVLVNEAKSQTRISRLVLGIAILALVVAIIALFK